MIDEKLFNSSIRYLYCWRKTISEKIIRKITNHMNRYNLSGHVCAFYTNLEDFFEDWEKIGYTRTEARKLLHGGIGEFQIIKDFGIVRYVIE